jgi:hypothetical protein
MQVPTILKFNKYNNRRYMLYRRKTFTPVLEVVNEINFESIVDELLLEKEKINQKIIEDANNKLTLFERAILCEINFWKGNYNS